MIMQDPVIISQKLIQYPSITPDHVGTIDLISSILTDLGFTCQKFTFYDHNYQANVDNLYAKLGTNGKNFCFAGHTDVVPVGEISKWTVDPFAGIILDHKLYGRGATDMKCAIACFIAAVAELISQNNHSNFNNTISLLLTGDEEGFATNGTTKVLEILQTQGEQFDVCLLGEPSNPKIFGEMIKIGRRGSLNATLTINGQQGHVAYPECADNPIDHFTKVFKSLKEQPLDYGDQFFQPSNLEFTSIDVNNATCNIIPNTVHSKFNVRFNQHYTAETLIQAIKNRLDPLKLNYTLTTVSASEPFINHPQKICELLTNAIKETVNITPQLGTTGGTSDARFIQALCPVVEFGLVAHTAHHIDEHVMVKDVYNLKTIYQKILTAHCLDKVLK